MIINIFTHLTITNEHLIHKFLYNPVDKHNLRLLQEESLGKTAPIKHIHRKIMKLGVSNAVADG